LIDYTNHIRVRLAAHALAQGSVVAYPTEAVWGLGCDPENWDAAEKILILKSRKVEKGLILIASSIKMLEPYLSHITTQQRNLLIASWPGPTTWLVPNNYLAPPWITGGQKTLALRVTAHPLAAALSKLFGGPIVSTSANPQGLPEARTLTKVKDYFGKSIDTHTPGHTGNTPRPSEIRDLLSGQVIRSGS
jgi:L-threonylcarbamoyladenylate synthase